MIINCIKCNKEKKVRPAHVKKGWGKYCSRECSGTLIQKGSEPWNKGIKSWVKPWFGKKRPHMLGDKHPGWKGDNVGYYGLHVWVIKELGQPNTCEFCKTSGLCGNQIHWANKSHKYKRDVNDWLRLCVSCHRKYDKGVNSYRYLI